MTLLFVTAAAYLGLSDPIARRDVALAVLLTAGAVIGIDMLPRAVHAAPPPPALTGRVALPASDEEPV